MPPKTPRAAVTDKNGLPSLRLPLFLQGYDYALRGDRNGARMYLGMLETSSPGSAAVALLQGILVRAEGDETAALPLLQAANALAPRQPVILLPLALCLQRLGDLAGSEQILFQAIAAAPAEAELYEQLARLALRQGKDGLAVEAATQATTLSPRNSGYWNTFGVALRRENRLDDAIIAWRQALVFAPDSVAVLNNLAESVRSRGGLAEAETYYCHALSLLKAAGKPIWVPCEGLALIYLEHSRWDDARAVLEDALAANPVDNIVGRRMLLVAQASLLRQTLQLDAALEALRELDGNEDAQVWNARALTYIQQGEKGKAIEALQQALILEEGNPDVLANMCLMCLNLGDIAGAGQILGRLTDEEKTLPAVKKAQALLLLRQKEYLASLLLYEEILQREPDNTQALGNAAYIHFHSQNYDLALRLCERALQCGGREPELLNIHASILLDLRRFDEAYQVWITGIRNAMQHTSWNESWSMLFSNLCMALHYDDQVTLEDHQDILQRFAAFMHDLPDDLQAPHLQSRDPDRRLRIGYLSADFRYHSVACFFKPLLESFDRSAVEITLYSSVEDPDAMTDTLRGLADHYVDITYLSEEKAAGRIRQDQIDVLIDLSGHTGRNRLVAMEYRPAPVQLTWLGYPGSTGLRMLNGRIVDHQTDPDGMQEWYSEPRIRLPRCFLAYQAPGSDPLPVAEPPCVQAGYVTFGSFNNSFKISAAVVRAWSAILRAVPSSRLFLKARQYQDAHNAAALLAEFAAEGIAAGRIELSGRKDDFLEHLATYHRIDLALDTFPYHGTTTTCEAMWMGVPTLTLAGDRHATRVGVSLLSAVGLEKQLVARDIDDYITRAVSFASSLEDLREVRHNLRDRMSASPLCDAEGLARAMEQAIRTEWRRWCASPGPSYGKRWNYNGQTSFAAED